MSRSTSNPNDSLSAPREIGRAEIEAAIREGHRLRAEAFKAWLSRAGAGLHLVVIRLVAILRGRRIAG